MSATSATARLVLVIAGCALMLYGFVQLVDSDQVWQVLPWAVGPVVVHDALVAPLIVVVGWWASRHAPAASRTPLLTAAIVSGGLLAVAASVLTRAGALPDNPTLLDRNYGVGLLVVLAAVWLGALVATAVNRRRTRGAGS
jgi:hypothetical protein